MIKLRKLNLESVKGRKVLLRVDINVPVKGSVPDDSVRLKSALLSIEELQRAGARVIVLAHRGRPNGVDPDFSIEPMARWFIKKLVDDTVFFQNAATFDSIQDRIHTMAPGDVLFLENLRFHPGEKVNDLVFAEQLASLGDIYVNDAFGNSHRAHASMTGITRFIESYAGSNIIKELKALEPIVNPKRRPFVAIVGGAKISSKLHAIRRLLDHADKVFVGGAIATAFFAAQGKEIGESYFVEKEIVLARELMGHHALRLPQDLLVKNNEDEYRVTSIENLKKDESIVDIGKKAIADIAKESRKAKLILWNGPVGVIEVEKSRAGSDAMVHIVAEVAKGSAYGVIGGGDTINLPFELGLADFIDHISTGGGAMLEYVGGQSLPALELLKEE